MVADFTIKDSRIHAHDISVAGPKTIDKEDITKSMSEYQDVPSYDGWEKDSDSYALGAEPANKKENTKANTYLDEVMGKLTITSTDAWESANNNYYNSYAKRDVVLVRAEYTYIDEDGEVVNISTNRELEDAFRQFVKKCNEARACEKLRFQITITIPKD